MHFKIKNGAYVRFEDQNGNTLQESFASRDFYMDESYLRAVAKCSCGECSKSLVIFNHHTGNRLVVEAQDVNIVADEVAIAAVRNRDEEQAPANDDVRPGDRAGKGGEQ